MEPTKRNGELLANKTHQSKEERTDHIQVPKQGQERSTDVISTWMEVLSILLLLFCLPYLLLYPGWLPPPSRMEE